MRAREIIFTFAPRIGEMAEWSIVAVSKTVEPQGSGGSNPSLSASLTDSFKKSCRDLQDFSFQMLSFYGLRNIGWSIHRLVFNINGYEKGVSCQYQ